MPVCVSRWFSLRPDFYRSGYVAVTRVRVHEPSLSRSGKHGTSPAGDGRGRPREPCDESYADRASHASVARLRDAIISEVGRASTTAALGSIPSPRSRCWPTPRIGMSRGWRACCPVDGQRPKSGRHPRRRSLRVRCRSRNAHNAGDRRQCTVFINLVQDSSPHYHLERNHQGLENRLITTVAVTANENTDLAAPVARRERLGVS